MAFSDSAREAKAKEIIREMRVMHDRCSQNRALEVMRRIVGNQAAAKAGEHHVRHQAAREARGRRHCVRKELRGGHGEVALDVRQRPQRSPPELWIREAQVPNHPRLSAFKVLDPLLPRRWSTEYFKDGFLMRGLVVRRPFPRTLQRRRARQVAPTRESVSQMLGDRRRAPHRGPIHTSSPPRCYQAFRRAPKNSITKRFPK